MLRIKKKEILGRPRGLLNVTNYSMQNSSLSRETDMPSSYTPLGQGLWEDSSSQWSQHGSIRGHFGLMVLLSSTHHNFSSTYEILCEDLRKRECTAREWNQQNGNRRGKKRFTVWRTSVKYSQPFHLGKSHFCTSQEKNFHFLFCSQAKTVTWQCSIPNKKHRQNFASYHSGYTTWSLSFTLYFGCLSLQSASYSGQGLSTTLMTTHANSVKRNAKLFVQILTFGLLEKYDSLNDKLVLKNENTQVPLLTQQTKIAHTQSSQRVL